MPPLSHTWIPYLYLYGVGGMFFLLGMFLIRKSGAMNLEKRHHRRWSRILIFGFLWFMALHALLTIAALYW